VLAFLRRALARVPADHQEAVELRDVRGLGIQTAAKIAGVSEREFRRRLHRGRVALHAELDRYLAVGPG
jgi:DNA-directed RNA polymerase specialized sigma24 family protein